MSFGFNLCCFKFNDFILFIHTSHFLCMGHVGCVKINPITLYSGDFISVINDNGYKSLDVLFFAMWK